MKSLKDYIFEEYEEYRITEVEIPYKVGKENIITFEVPETYSEDDFQIYIQDMYLTEFPGDDSNSEEFFGVNAEKIYDTLFEYDKYEKSDEKPQDYIEFDKSKDSKVKDEDKLVFVSLEGLRYIIKFDEFDLKEENTTDIKDTVIEIFKRCESSETNKYPLQLTLDTENIKYK